VPQQEELQHGGNRSVKARGASRWWQKWDLEGKFPSPPPFFIFAFFCYEEDGNDVLVVFFCLFFLLQRRR